MEILQLIERMESLVGSGTRLPLAHRAIVDEEQLRGLVERIRGSIPEALLEAEQIVKQRDEMLSQAKREANQITSSADEDYRSKVQDSHVIKAAEKRAQEILNEAQRQSRVILNNAEKQATARRKDANQYTLDVLRKLDGQLSSLLTSIRKGVTMLEKEGENDQG